VLFVYLLKIEPQGIIGSILWQKAEQFTPEVFNNGTSSERHRMAYQFVVFLSHNDCLLLHMVSIVAIMGSSRTPIPITLPVHTHTPAIQLTVISCSTKRKV
jgi:hypothetical protein